MHRVRKTSRRTSRMLRTWEVFSDGVSEKMMTSSRMPTANRSKYSLRMSCIKC